MKLRIIKVHGVDYHPDRYIVEERFMFFWKECNSFPDTSAKTRYNYSHTLLEAEKWVISRRIAQQHWFKVDNPKKEIVKYIK